MQTQNKPNPPHQHKIPVVIDRQHYEFEASGNPYSGLQIRERAGIGADYDLNLKRPGDDEVILDDRKVRLEPGMHFYSTKKVINLGGSNASS